MAFCQLKSLFTSTPIFLSWIPGVSLWSQSSSPNVIQLIRNCIPVSSSVDGFLSGGKLQRWKQGVACSCPGIAGMETLAGGFSPAVLDLDGPYKPVPPQER